jgi:hypothetical protein
VRTGSQHPGAETEALSPKMISIGLRSKIQEDQPMNTPFTISPFKTQVSNKSDHFAYRTLFIVDYARLFSLSTPAISALETIKYVCKGRASVPKRRAAPAPHEHGIPNIIDGPAHIRNSSNSW